MALANRVYPPQPQEVPTAFGEAMPPRLQVGPPTSGAAGAAFEMQMAMAGMDGVDSGVETAPVLRRRRHCLNPRCRAANYSRGLCRACYAAAHRLVVAGQATWDDLERNHRALPAHGLSRQQAEARVAWLLEDARGQSRGRHSA